MNTLSLNSQFTRDTPDDIFEGHCIWSPEYIWPEEYCWQRVGMDGWLVDNVTLEQTSHQPSMICTSTAMLTRPSSICKIQIHFSVPTYMYMQDANRDFMFYRLVPMKARIKWNEADPTCVHRSGKMIVTCKDVTTCTMACIRVSTMYSFKALKWYHWLLCRSSAFVTAVVLGVRTLQTVLPLTSASGAQPLHCQSTWKSRRKSCDADRRAA